MLALSLLALPNGTLSRRYRLGLEPTQHLHISPILMFHRFLAFLWTGFDTHFGGIHRTIDPQRYAAWMTLSLLQISFILTLLHQFCFVQLLQRSHLFRLRTHRILSNVKQQIGL